MALKLLAKGEICSVVDVTVIRLIAPGKAIIAESNKNAAILLIQEKVFEGQAVKLIKPAILDKEPLTLQKNPIFKLQKGTQKDIKLKEDLLSSLTEKANKMSKACGVIGDLAKVFHIKSLVELGYRKDML